MRDPRGVEVVRARIVDAIRKVDIETTLRRRGVVRAVGDGVATAAGLDEVGYEELVVFDSGALGMATDLTPDDTGIVLLSSDARIVAGEGVRGLGRLPSIPGGTSLLGRIVDPLGLPLDGGPPIEASPARELFPLPPELVDRRSVERPLYTGITVIDAAIPIGRGQRELVIGDRDVGKTSLVLDCIAAQRHTGVRCVYVAIGQPMSRILAARDTLARAGCLENTVIVAAESSMPPGIQYLAPYAGATVAESLTEQGGDALVAYDDMTKHADAYRQLALLLGRPTGREAFPGDIFHIHAELLERAASLADGRSVTALPIVETTESDISGYIPTNLISITDGQIYLDTARFERNERPAVDVGRSVSRIGAAAQPASVRAASRNLRVNLARFESLEALTRVGLEIEPATRTTLERGALLRELLRQPRLRPRSVSREVFELVAVDEGWLDGVPPREAPTVLARALESGAEVLSALDPGQPPDQRWLERAAALVRDARATGTR